MSFVEIVFLTLQLSLVGVVVGIFWKFWGNQTQIDPGRTPVEVRIEALEVGFMSLKAEVAEGIERANRSYARVVAKESHERRKAERAEDFGEEEPSPQLQLIDAGGGEEKAVPPVYQGVDGYGGSHASWADAGRIYARSLIEG